MRASLLFLALLALIAVVLGQSGLASDALVFDAPLYEDASQVTQADIDEMIERSNQYFALREAELKAANGGQLGLAGVQGIDFSTALSTSTLSCIRGKLSGRQFSIPRGYRSTGTLDPNVVSNVKNSWAAGYSYVDTYLFPRPASGNGAAQVQALASKLRSGGAKFGMIWLDVEGTQYWSSNRSTNQAFFQQMLAGCAAAKVNCGVYTSKSQWDPIMGSYNGGSRLNLWYARYNNVPNFNDFVPFGGWSKPNIKQYIGDTTLCGAGVDINIY